MGNRLSITMTITDILKSRTFKSHLRTEWLASDSKLSRNSRIVFLGATYRFGNAVKRGDNKNLDYDQ